MSEIRSADCYKKIFTGPPSDRAMRTEALKCALDIRKFEIELYWKRAAYFWTLIAASFAGYFALLSAKNDHPPQGAIFLISCVGLILSVGWYLVNRGSKYWQTNWERHVDILEDEIMGPLYKTTIAKEEFSFWSLHDGYPFSVSKVNQLISLFIILIWIGLAVRAFPYTQWNTCYQSIAYFGLAGLTIIFVVCLFFFCIGGSEGKSRKINMRKSELKDKYVARTSPHSIR
jgi:hypothetical protein